MKYKGKTFNNFRSFILWCKDARSERFTKEEIV